MKFRNLILTPMLFIVAFFMFILLDVGINVEQKSQLIQPLFFALTLIVSIFYAKFRKYLLICSLTCLTTLVITYLFGMISVSDWVGSLGFGMLLITIFSYLPQVIKKGYIEKF